MKGSEWKSTEMKGSEWNLTEMNGSELNFKRWWEVNGI